MKWDEGRQGSGYSKLTLFFSKRFKCDAYILKIPKGVAIPQHVDLVPNANHHRVNITLRGRIRMEVNGKSFCLGDWFSYFRPDITPHSAPAVVKDTYLFSFGWLT